VRVVPLAALALLAAGCAGPRREPAARSAVAAPQPLAVLPPVRHVFVIVLENQSYRATFGPGSAAPYLADSLPAAGALLRQYYGIGHNSLDNYIALISGIAPNPRTQADCPRYEEFHETGTAPDGQPVGTGCIYPAYVPTIANQLEARQLTWKGYMEDMGNDPAREAARCGHVPVGTSDRTERAERGDQYAAKHDPFVYFHAVLDGPSCAANVAPLSELRADLQSPASTPNYAFIVPNLCHDGHDSPCVDGAPGGLPAIDGFLRQWVPVITRSPAYADGGLLIVTFDEALGSDASACCGEPAGPNTRHPGVSGPGGGRTGAVLLSPFIRPGTVSDVPYNHYALLRSVEDAFGLPHLGYAAQPGLASFGADVYTAAGAAK
jgi:phosphatidylinositol-3-phosphatase